MKKIGIVIAIEREMIAYLNSGHDIEELHNKKITYYKSIINNHEVYAIKSGYGLVDAAAATQFLITVCDVDVIFNFGVTGALDPTLKVSDLFYVERCLNFDYDTSAVDPVKPHQYDDFDNDYIRLDESLIELVKVVEPTIKPAFCASSDAFIEKKEDKLIRYEEGCQICDMEIASIARIAKKNLVKCLSIKCISDTFDGDGSHFEENVRNSADKAFDVLNRLILALK